MSTITLRYGFSHPFFAAAENAARHTVLVAGGNDPEMVACRAAADAYGLRIMTALCNGKAVHGGNAWKADAVGNVFSDWTEAVSDFEGFNRALLIEVFFASGKAPAGLKLVVIDHHGRHPRASCGPEQAFEASSIGQLWIELARMGLPAPKEWGVAEGFGSGQPGELQSQGSELAIYFRDPEASEGTSCYLVPLDLRYEAMRDHTQWGPTYASVPWLDLAAYTRWCEARVAEHNGWNPEVLAAAVRTVADLIANAAAAEGLPGNVADLRGRLPASLPEGITLTQGRAWAFVAQIAALQVVLDGDAPRSVVLEDGGSLGMYAGGTPEPFAAETWKAWAAAQGYSGGSSFTEPTRRIAGAFRLLGL